VGYLERALYIRRRLFQEASPELAQACRQLCEAYNAAATGMLQKEKLQGAYDLLKRAEQLAETSGVDRAVTWNNMACYYRRVGKIRAAVTFLERALQVEEHRHSGDAAQTHLNLCATLSQLRRHDAAIYHAQCALIRVYEMLSPAMMGGELGDAKEANSEPKEAVTVLCIAYHNLAVEHEHLRNYESAMGAFVEGLRWASRFLPVNHDLTNILKSSIEAIQVKLPAASAALRRASELLKGPPSGDQTLDALPEGPPVGLGQAESLVTPREPAAAEEAQGAAADDELPDDELPGGSAAAGAAQA